MMDRMDDPAFGLPLFSGTPESAGGAWADELVPTPERLAELIRERKDRERKDRKNTKERERRANDPEYRERRNAKARERIRERRANDPEWRDPEWRERRNAKRRERDRERRANDPEWWERHNAKRRERQREQRRWRWANDPEWREKQKARGRENHHRRANDPEWRERRNAKRRERDRERRANDPEYRERRNSTNGMRRYRIKLTAELIIRQDGLCGICNGPLPPNMKAIHRDHIVPLAAGGSDDPSNLQAVHAACNLAKGAKHDGEPQTRRHSGNPGHAGEHRAGDHAGTAKD